jgi:TIR domain
MAGGDGGAGSGAGPGWRWDVALSFAGAQRDYVEQVAAALKARGMRCFYDADEQIELWGRYLAEELPAIYAEQAAVVVVFVSAEYAAQDWTRLERRAALGRAVRERREYVLPARFDDTPLPGLLSDMVTVDARTKTPRQFAAMVAVKLADLGVAEPAPVGAGDLARDDGAGRPAVAASATAAVRRQPDQASHNARASRWGSGKALTGAIAVAAVVLAGVGYLVTQLGGRAVGAVGGTGSVARQFIYTAHLANDAPITLPDAVIADLRQIGLAHQRIALTRVAPSGNVSTSVIDMTPRAGNSASSPVIEVTSFALHAIYMEISGIETAINSPAAPTGDGHALYTGLTRTDFTGAPVTIISSGLDLANPDDFRSLKWTIPPQEVVAAVKRAGALPALHGPVTFVIVPAASPQPQLGQAQKKYLRALWTALLTAAGAHSVTFINADASTAISDGPDAPIVPVPGMPGTP